MEVGGTETPQPNELDIHLNHAYAATHMARAKVVEFLTTKLEPVKLEELGPDERLCAICQQEFHVSEDVKISHPPIKTVCGHIFGKPCLTKWLDPLCYRGLDDRPAVVDRDAGPFGRGKTDCPMCRRVFFPKYILEPLEYLVQRLLFWDKAYASVGITRSEREEVSRKHLWEYVEYCRLINEQPEIDGQAEYDTAQFNFWLLAVNLSSQQLTPKQQELKIKLIEIGKKDLTVEISESGDYVFHMTRVDKNLQVLTSRRWTLRSFVNPSLS